MLKKKKNSNKSPALQTVSDETFLSICCAFSSKFPVYKLKKTDTIPCIYETTGLEQSSKSAHTFKKSRISHQV